jgi:hypothetical protein
VRATNRPFASDVAESVGTVDSAGLAWRVVTGSWLVSLAVGGAAVLGLLGPTAEATLALASAAGLFGSRSPTTMMAATPPMVTSPAARRLWMRAQCTWPMAKATSPKMKIETAMTAKKPTSSPR